MRSRAFFFVRRSFCRSSDLTATMEFTASDIANAYEKISSRIQRTPVLTSSQLDRAAGCKLYFKAECFQKTGSFKARGALFAVSKVIDEGRTHSVITHSSGNHGQALAYAAQTFGLACTVVVPRNAPACKVDALTKTYGARVVLCEPTMASRAETCRRLIDETGATMVHPHDDTAVMTGQGTIALEFLEQAPHLDCILVPVGGGGMLGGIAVWTKHRRPACKVYAVEPVGKELGQNLTAGCQPAHTDSTAGTIDTIADGIRVKFLGGHCFPVVRELCEKTVFSVTDEEIVSAMRLAYERLKVVIEPSSATGLAAVLSREFAEQRTRERLEHVGVVLCGGNVDLSMLGTLFGAGEKP